MRAWLGNVSPGLTVDDWQPSRTTSPTQAPGRGSLLMEWRSGCGETDLQREENRPWHATLNIDTGVFGTLTKTWKKLLSFNCANPRG
ncbi:unnamed protein product [Caretta caretta]